MTCLSWCLSSPLLQKLPDDLPGMTNLQQLSVRGTRTSLAELPDSIAALSDLQDLRLHGCHLLQVIGYRFNMND